MTTHTSTYVNLLDPKFHMHREGEKIKHKNGNKVTSSFYIEQVQQSVLNTCYLSGKWLKCCSAVVKEVKPCTKPRLVVLLLLFFATFIWPPLFTIHSILFLLIFHEAAGKYSNLL